MKAKKIPIFFCLIVVPGPNLKTEGEIETWGAPALIFSCFRFGLVHFIGTRYFL